MKTIFEILGRHPIHPFPARMAPEIALEALGKNESVLRVLDPMAGSGTALAVARAKGHRAIGFDLDPLATLLARVWTRTTDADAVRDRALKVLNRAKVRFPSLSSRFAYPSGADDETRRFIRYWFDDYARRQLAALAASIRQVRDESTREVLWCGFSRLIITKQAGASLAMDLSHSRPHRMFRRAPVKPFRRFISAIDAVVTNCPQPGTNRVGPPTTIRQGDARRLRIASESIDLVLTSPPYLNAIDYMRCSKFSLVWMGYRICELRRIRGESIGAEASSEEAARAAWVAAMINSLKLEPMLTVRDHGLLAQYVWDMGQSLSEVSRVLRPGGRAVYVVGDSTVKGSFIRNSAIIAGIAQKHGLFLAFKRSRALPANRRYLPPPKRDASSTAMNARMRREVVMVFNKPAEPALSSGR